MNILVTGGAGFIGSRVVDILIRNKYKVIVVDDLSLGNKKNVNYKAKFYQLDINSKSLEEIFKKNKINAIIHLAAHISARASMQKPIFDAKTNIIGSLRLLELARKYKVNKFVYASSVAVYGEPEYLPFDESHSLNPMCNYGISKHVVEHYIYTYSKLYGIDYSVLRFSNVFGPRQDPNGEAGVISIFIDNILNNRSVLINGDGNQTRDFVFVEDVAKAIVLALKKNTGKKIMNISSNKETSINQIFEMLKKIINKDVIHKHVKPIPGEVKYTRIDNSIAKRELSWIPRISIEEGLKRTVNYYKKRFKANRFYLKSSLSDNKLSEEVYKPKLEIT